MRHGHGETVRSRSGGRGQLPGQETSQRLAAAQLAAGGARQAARGEQPHTVGDDTGAFQHSFGDASLDGVIVTARHGVTGVLGQDQQRLAVRVGGLEPQRHRAPRTHTRDV